MVSNRVWLEPTILAFVVARFREFPSRDVFICVPKSMSDIVDLDQHRMLDLLTSQMSLPKLMKHCRPHQSISFTRHQCAEDGFEVQIHSASDIISGDSETVNY